VPTAQSTTRSVETTRTIGFKRGWLGHRAATAPALTEALIITPATLGAVPAAVAFSDLASLMLVNAGAAKALAIAAVSIVTLAAPLPVAPANGMRGCISRGC